MKKYDLYKDSGVKWIGEVPSHWRLKKLKYVSNVLISSVDKHIYPDEIQVSLCNYTDVCHNKYITKCTKLKKGSCNENEYKKFSLCKGNVIITKDCDTGIPALVKDDLEGVVCGYHLAIIKPIKIHGEFIFWFIQSGNSKKYLEINSKGVTKYGLGKSLINNLVLVIPPLHEQEKIVSFLDSKTTLISSLIEKSQRKIELYKEKRSSLISEVVTKGLNPNVEMKNSGIEWIGEVPSHWRLSIVGRHFNIGRGRVISKVEIEENKGKYSVYSSQTSNNGELGRINTYDFDGKYVTWTTDGVHTGTCFYREGKFNTTNVCGMLSNRNIPYSLKFLSYYLNQVTKPYVRIDINPKLMNNMMSEVPLVIPPLNEQEKIVKYLDKQTQLIEKKISIEEKRIELLKEYRQSLISEVVIGKQKVF